MKKAGLLLATFLLSFIVFYYVDGDAVLYTNIIYLFPQRAFHQLFTILFMVLMLLYFYYAVYQYEDMRTLSIVRIGKRAYVKKIAVTYMIHYLLWVFVNIGIDMFLQNPFPIIPFAVVTVVMLLPVIFHIKMDGKALFVLLLVVGVLRYCLSII